jgi:hypothetical protein
MNPKTDRIEAVPLRTAEFTANVTNLLESKPGNLQIGDLDLTDYFTTGRIDCTVTLRHPFPGLGKYSGFDVWGVFMHNGASALDYDGLTYSCGPDPYPNEATLLNADGYTRWFNQPEFDGSGQPLFEYWPGKVSTLPTPTAMLNPFKIFADGLGVEDDYYQWITTGGNAEARGIFRAGQANSRRYRLQFPIIGGVPVLEFQYAAVATWEPGDPTLTGDPATYDPSDFPTSANVEEPFFVHVSTAASDLYYGGPGQSGGSLRADVEVFDWQGGSVGGNGVPNEVERIIIEGSFLTGGTHDVLKPELASIASSGTVDSSVFEVEIPDCAPKATGSAEYWVIVEAGGLNGGSYGQGFPTEYPDPARRAAFSRNAVEVHGEVPKEIEITAPNGGEEWVVGYHYGITWTTANNIGNIKLEYSKDGFVGDIHQIIGSTEDDGLFDWQVPDDPSTTVRVRGTLLDSPDVYDDSDADFAIVPPPPVPGWARTFGTYGYWELPLAFAVDGSGNSYFGGQFMDAMDFDPGPGSDYHYTNGSIDAWVSKFDNAGNLKWARSWGGSSDDNTFACCVDGSGNVYATGRFQTSVDFDPGSGTDVHNVIGSADIFLSKFDSSGNFQWARTWGGTAWDEGWDVVCDASGNVYVVGWFGDVVDFDPGNGESIYSAVGGRDVCVSRFSSSGSFQWARTWGGGADDRGCGLAVNSAGDIYVTCNYTGPADFDPGPGVDSHSGTGVGLSKFDPTGAFKWARTWAGRFENYGEGVAVDGSQNIYACAEFTGTVDLDPGAGVDNRMSAGSNDIFLSKFDPSGGYLWGRTWGSTDSDVGYEVAVDSSGNTAITGWYNLTVDFDPGAGVDNHTSNGGYGDVYLVKLDSSGNFIWARTWGGTGGDEGWGVGFDGSGNVYTAGYFYYTVDFDPCAGVDERTSAGYFDLFLTMCHPDGCW